MIHAVTRGKVRYLSVPPCRTEVSLRGKRELGELQKEREWHPLVLFYLLFSSPNTRTLIGKVSKRWRRRRRATLFYLSALSEELTLYGDATAPSDFKGMMSPWLRAPVSAPHVCVRARSCVRAVLFTLRSINLVEAIPKSNWLCPSWITYSPYLTAPQVSHRRWTSSFRRTTVVCLIFHPFILEVLLWTAVLLVALKPCPINFKRIKGFVHSFRVTLIYDLDVFGRQD